MSFMTIFSVVSSFFQATWSVTWKRRLIIASGFVACLALGYSLGRFAVPAKVETREVEKVVTKIETQIEWKERVVVQKEKAQTRVIYVDRVIEPGGKVHEVIKTVIDTKEHTDSAKDKSKEEKQSAQATSTREVIKTVTNQPRWRVGVDVGWSWPEPKVVIYGPLIIGVRVDYRIVGGLGVGVWANTSVAAGAGLSYQF